MKILGRLIPYASAIIIMLGVLRHYIYYTYFNLSIKNYVNTSEFLLMFADEAFIIAFIYFITMGLMLVSSGIYTPKPQILVEKNNDKKYEVKPLFSYDWIVVLFINIIGLALMNYINDYYTRVMLGTALYLIDITYSAKIVRIKLVKDNSETFNSSLFNFAFVGAMAITLIPVLSTLEAAKVAHYSYYGTKITTTDSTYVSDSTSFYIGKTQEYTFIYNQRDKSSTVIPNSEIKKMEIHKR